MGNICWNKKASKFLNEFVADIKWGRLQENQKDAVCLDK